ncbi:PAS-domain containing protein [Rhodopila globiformis]|uniref:PAS domain-containing protein n=1 Tax=Rhodopila globiformis TaxID=1071 RepID=A0A2S6N520_RHOGL|nr:PAS-domain containing protein [Rhodopila globiformis]PPQ29699.1 hypothetical protein CCS01_20610 [Rhodopila globiformis]
MLVSILAIRRSRNQSRLEAINVALLVEAERCSCKQRERLAEQEKTRQFQVLEHIMDSISQGLMMFDRDFRLVVCNAAADVVFGLPAGTFRAGMMPDDILSALMSIGAVSKSHIDDILAFYFELGRRSGPPSSTASALTYEPWR